MKMRVAVIDDEESACRLIKMALEQDGFEVETFLTGHLFLVRLEENPFHIAFIDLQLPDLDGLKILNLIKQFNEDIEALIVTGHSSVETALEATSRGAFHYITKPCKRHDIRLLALRAQEKIELREENRKLKLAIRKDNPLSGIVGASPAMQEIFAMIEKVALVNCNVLLQAETGTGKQMVARAIHAISPRKENPFVHFNCAGFSDELICSELFGHEKGAFTGAQGTKVGLFESAAGGTVLLDEIGEMPMSMQVKLLHVLQERQILRVGGTRSIDLDIRIIAATNVDLKKAIDEGRFREDLFYRLNVVGIHLPKLREKREDISLLCAYFIDKFNLAFNKKVKKLSPQTLELLNRYHYPGNVRELENIIQRAVALAEGTTIHLRDLPARLTQDKPWHFADEKLLSMDDMEKGHILKVLNSTGFNKTETCSILKLSRTTLWRRMKKLNIPFPDN
ncbi:MAG: sigma-54-dependent Fis family transcriptional regulator [Deltaproteobacteria bacterium]|nr:sigma-54-dependent Fis family transcriptional regulator [Deltaproteobacteria bacterium]